MTTPIAIDDLPVYHDEVIHRGASWPLLITWEDMDLTGCVVRLVVLDSSRNVLLSKSSADDEVAVTADTSGEAPVSTVQSEATPEETALIPSTATHGVYEVRVDDPAGRTYPLAKGAIRIERGAAE